jgi:pimeloyl-ACP methyl ester carboxylesterase
LAVEQTQSRAFPQFKSDEGRNRYLAAYDAVLRDWPVPCEALELPTRLGPTHVIASGPPDAPPLVLLPSFAGTATVWRPNVEALSRHYRTYAVDVIGQPGRSVTTRASLTRSDYADWLTDLLDALGVERASIVGCSFGGFVALSQAALTPERVGRVVLISPVGAFADQSWRLIYLMRVKGPFLRFMRRLAGDERAPNPSDVLGARFDPADARWRALMAVTMSEAPEVSAMPSAAFSGAELRAIRAPTLLLIGDRERLYDPHATLALARKRMPGLQGAIVPDADHIAAMSQPEDVNARILKFLEVTA